MNSPLAPLGRRGTEPHGRRAAGLRLDLLDPWEMSRLGGIEVLTDDLVEGFLAGLHRSPRRGFGVEFAEHRMYQPGDELRYVDWKMLGRSDRLYVRQYEEETNLRAMLVLDVSRSMAWTGDAEATLPKLDYARRLTAALSMVLLRQRDAVGLITFDEEVRSVVPPRARLTHWHQVAATLAAARPGPGTAADPALRRVVDQLRRRGLVVFISDLLLDQSLAFAALRYLRHRGHQVVVAHVMDPAELALTGQQEVRLEDPETGEAVVLRPRDWAGAYRDTVEQTIREWNLRCRRHGIAYHHVTTDTPIGPALREIVGGGQSSQRARSGRSGGGGAGGRGGAPGAGGARRVVGGSRLAGSDTTGGGRVERAPSASAGRSAGARSMRPEPTPESPNRPAIRPPARPPTRP